MQTVRAILRNSGRAGARRTLCRDAFHTHGQTNQNTEKQDGTNKMPYRHTCSFIEAWPHTQ
jgi:hypothetical protein